VAALLRAHPHTHLLWPTQRSEVHAVLTAPTGTGLPGAAVAVLRRPPRRHEQFWSLDAPHQPPQLVRPARPDRSTPMIGMTEPGRGDPARRTTRRPPTPSSTGNAPRCATWSPTAAPNNARPSASNPCCGPSPKRAETATPAYGALSTMREQRSHLALVHDDDRLLGLVTLQDLLDGLLPLRPAGTGRTRPTPDVQARTR
jgi:hypothetical protein